MGMGGWPGCAGGCWAMICWYCLISAFSWAVNNLTPEIFLIVSIWKCPA